MRPYNPVRKPAVDTADPLEIELVYNVSSCGSCSYFWPHNVEEQPYGPYPSFDFVKNMPAGEAANDRSDYFWLKGKTTEPGFPTGEIMDGCRKAPIMTIGINPNLTAFSPGRQGASWIYPNFTSDHGMDEWTKYAYYYRYRNVYQEHVDFEIIKQYVIPGSGIKAKKNGVIRQAVRTSDASAYYIEVQYEGDGHTTRLNIPGSAGETPYVLLFNTSGALSHFKAGDDLAVRLNIPPGTDINVHQAQLSYYKQFMPSLATFEQYLKDQKNITDANLAIGEDVCQLDMVACASPHWGDQYLGGSASSENTVINNCVAKNAWAVKQLVQTKPVVLLLVGESSWLMFNNTFGSHIKKQTPLSKHPEDGAFTLFRETLNHQDPCLFEFSTVIDGHPYQLSTRIIVTPHFSFDTYFLPQFRMSHQSWTFFSAHFKDCYTFLFNHPDIKYTASADPSSFISIAIVSNVNEVLSTLANEYKDAYMVLQPFYYEPHKQMANVLTDLYDSGKLSYTKPVAGKNGYLTRAEGACQFCVNSHWTFPSGCPYGKTKEQPPPPGMLKKVVQQLINHEKNSKLLESQLSHSLFITR